MPRLRMVYTFLWHLIYGHPLNKSLSGDPNAPAVTPDLEVSPGVQDIPQSPGVQESADTAAPEHQQYTGKVMTHLTCSLRIFNRL